MSTSLHPVLHGAKKPPMLFLVRVFNMISGIIRFGRRAPESQVCPGDSMFVTTQLLF